MKSLAIALLTLAAANPAFAGPNTQKVSVTNGPDRQMVSLSRVASHAIEQSKLTIQGSVPFHLKASIVETTNPDSTYKAEIDEYWLSPEKWRRTIQSLGFSQTLIVNGDKLSEKDTGDYYPWWLNELVIAIFDPLPMLDQLKQINAQIAEPRGSGGSSVCARLQSKPGILVFCFKSAQGLLDYVVSPGYSASFKDYQEFKNKQIAHRVVIDPEPGTTIEAKTTELTEIATPDESLFAIDQPTSPQDRLNRIRVDEEAARKVLLNSPDIAWPLVRKPPTSGRMALYISVDRDGQVREVWPKGSDNSDLEDPAREQVKKWRFKAAAINGAPVQMETVLTFTFQTKIDDSKPKP